MLNQCTFPRRPAPLDVAGWLAKGSSRKTLLFALAFQLPLFRCGLQRTVALAFGACLH